MIYAAREGHTDVVKLLYEFGADINHQDKVSCYIKNNVSFYVILMLNLLIALKFQVYFLPNTESLFLYCELLQSYHIIKTENPSR